MNETELLLLNQPLQLTRVELVDHSVWAPSPFFSYFFFQSKQGNQIDLFSFLSCL